MQIVLQGGLADFVVRAVRGGDGNSLDAVFARRLLGEHGFVIRIAAIRCHIQFRCECHASLRIDVKGAGNEFEIIVAERRTAVNIADLASFAAADHSPSNRVGGDPCSI